MAKQKPALFSGVAGWMALLFFALLTCGSEPIAPLVRLTLSGIAPGTDRIVLTVTKHGQTHTSELAGAGPFETITVGFPSGATGDATFSLLIYQGMCLVGSGSGTLTLAGDDVRELPILIMIPSLACGTPAAKIIVQVTNTGTAMGTVSSTNPQGGISCGNDCEEIYAVGSTVTLHAEVATGSFFGWSGACSDNNDCTLNLTSEGVYVVKAAFGIRACAGWCPADIPPTGFKDDLYGITGSSPSDIIAVGDNGAILHYDGLSWKTEASGLTSILRAVTLVRDSNPATYVAVGDMGKVIAKTGTGTWMPVTSQAGKLRGVMGYFSGGTTTLYAVGENGVLLKGDLTALNMPTSGVEAAPASLTGKHLNAITLQVLYSGSTRYLIVGDMAASAEQGFLPGWDQDVPMGSANLNGAYESNRRIVAVGAMGAMGATPMIFSRDYGFLSWLGWRTAMNLPTGIAALRAVWGSSDTSIVAVGDIGTVAKWDGAGWFKQPTNSTRNLYAVWGTSANNIYAVGEAGTILHYLP